MIDAILIMLAGYLLLGLIVGVGFVLRGVGRVDPVAEDAPLFFRLMILPGSVGLWPAVLVLWLRAARCGGGRKR